MSENKVVYVVLVKKPSYLFEEMSYQIMGIFENEDRAKRAITNSEWQHIEPHLLIKDPKN